MGTDGLDAPGCLPPLSCAEPRLTQALLESARDRALRHLCQPWRPPCTRTGVALRRPLRSCRRARAEHQTHPQLPSGACPWGQNELQGSRRRVIPASVHGVCVPGVGTGTGPGRARSARPVSAEFPPHPPTPPRPDHICRNHGPEALDRWPRGPELADSESGHLRCVSKVGAQRPHAQQAAVAGDPAGVPGQRGVQRGLWILPWVGRRPSEGRGRGGRRAPAAGVRVGTGRQEDGLRGVGPEPPSAASLIPARPALHPVGNPHPGASWLVCMGSFLP